MIRPVCRFACTMIVVFIMIHFMACSNMLGGNHDTIPVINDPTLLDAPGSIVVYPGSSCFSMIWEEVEGADTYEVWFSETNDLSTAEEYSGDPDPTDTYCSIAGLYNGLTYYVWVRALNSMLTSNYSKPGSATLDFAAPEITSAEEHDHRVIISWTRVSGAESYEVRYGTGDDVADAGLFADSDNTDTSCTITGLTNSTQYNVWVRAVNARANGPYSEDQDVTPYPVVHDRRTYTANGVSFDMVFVPGLTFPTGLDDSGTATVNRDYWMADTETTNELVATVLQWAYDQERFNTTNASAPNYLNVNTAKYRGQTLTNFVSGSGYTVNQINWSGSNFTITTGKENYPMHFISWYGAIMICTWLDEMIDSSSDQAVYTWTDTGNGSGETVPDGTWQDTETTTDNSKNGFRLPERNEWELAARYIGTEPPTVEPLATEVISTVNNDITYYWTPGSYASGATDDYTDNTATNLVTWNINNSYHIGSSGANTSHPDFGTHIVGTAGISLDGLTQLPEPKSSMYANTLDIFDMSGNVLEFCITKIDTRDYYAEGGNWWISNDYLRIGHYVPRSANYIAGGLGFRIVMTE